MFVGLWFALTGPVQGWLVVFGVDCILALVAAVAAECADHKCRARADSLVYDSLCANITQGMQVLGWLQLQVDSLCVRAS
jgi:hypothetical protein